MHPPKTPPRWPGGPPRSYRSRFFCLFCLNNYSKVFQKRRIFKLLLEGLQVGHPLGGAPPRPLGPPQWPPNVLEIWKKLQKFPKIILKFYMHQNTSNYKSNIHFGPLGPVGGALEGENLQEGAGGGFSEARAGSFSKCLKLVH